MRKVLLNAGRHDPLTSLGLLLLRVTPAVILIMEHGASKITAFGLGVSDPFGLGLTTSASVLVGVQLVAPILVGVGLFARPAALLVTAGLALLAFRFPWWDAGFAPYSDDVTSSSTLLYLASFAGVMFTGAGTFSLDRLLQGKGG